MRTQHTGRPRFYSEDRVDDKLEGYDRKVLGMTRVNPKAGRRADRTQRLIANPNPNTVHLESSVGQTIGLCRLPASREGWQTTKGDGLPHKANSIV